MTLFFVRLNFRISKSLFALSKGRVTVELGTLKKGDVRDEWYKLNAVASKREIKGSEIGTIRLKARYNVSRPHCFCWCCCGYLLFGLGHPTKDLIWQNIQHDRNLESFDNVKLAENSLIDNNNLITFIWKEWMVVRHKSLAVTSVADLQLYQNLTLSGAPSLFQ